MTAFKVDLTSVPAEREAKIINSKVKDPRFTMVKFGDSTLAFRPIQGAGRKALALITSVVSDAAGIDENVTDEELTEEELNKIMALPERIVEVLRSLSATPEQAKWIEEEDFLMTEIYSIFDVIKNTPEVVALEKK